MASPKVLTVTIHLSSLDKSRQPQEVARQLRALASLVDSTGHYPTAVQSKEGDTVLETKIT